MALAAAITFAGGLSALLLRGEPGGVRVGYAILSEGTAGGSTGGVAVGSYVLFDSLLRARADVTLRSLRPAQLDDGLELFAARVVTVSADAPTVSRAGYICGPKPTGFGPSVPPAGVMLKDGDYFVVAFYVRLAREGVFRSRDATLEYEIDGKLHRQTVRTNLLVAEPVRNGLSCRQDTSGGWFGPWPPRRT